MKRYAVLLAALLSLDAFAVSAYLVRQSMGRSVTGQPILICTYQYGRQQFDKIFPAGSSCPSAIEVQ